VPESKKFLLRLDPTLFDALRRWASDDLRSINSQIEYLLIDQARRAGRLPKQTSRRAPRDFPGDQPDSAATTVPTGARASR
jgi:hypothetical protein